MLNHQGDNHLEQSPETGFFPQEEPDDGDPFCECDSQCPDDDWDSNKCASCGKPMFSWDDFA